MKFECHNGVGNYCGIKHQSAAAAERHQEQLGRYHSAGFWRTEVIGGWPHAEQWRKERQTHPHETVAETLDRLNQP